MKKFKEDQAGYNSEQTITKNTTTTVDEIGKMDFSGNIIPHVWYHNLKLDSGKTDIVAIILLSDVIYWYKPTYHRDEASGLVTEITKKFYADKLQKNYTQWAEMFGFSKEQVKDATDRLVKKGLITREFRNIPYGKGIVASNVMFVEPVIEALGKITNKIVPIPPKTTPISPPEIPPHMGGEKGGTYTDITTDITTNSLSAITPIAEPMENIEKPTSGGSGILATPMATNIPYSIRNDSEKKNDKAIELRTPLANYLKQNTQWKGFKRVKDRETWERCEATDSDRLQKAVDWSIKRQLPLTGLDTKILSAFESFGKATRLENVDDEGVPRVRSSGRNLGL